MLILTRKRNQSIRIGSDIIVHVMRTKSGSVRIGIEAPASVRIARAELHDDPGAIDTDSVDADDIDADEHFSPDALLLQH